MYIVIYLYLINMEDKKISIILSVIVMKSEFEDIVSKEQYTKDDEFSNLHKEILVSYRKTYPSFTSIIITGVEDSYHKLHPVGTEIAFLLTYLGSKYYNPDIIVNTGYAGSSGYKKLKKGDIVISTEKGEYYRRSCILDYYEPFIKGLYPIKNFDKLGKELNFISGKIGTTDSFVADDNGEAKKKEITCVEMEFASISRIGHYLNKPVIGLKIISDGEEGDDNREKEFNESIENLGEVIYLNHLRLLFRLSDMNIHDLE